jgi:hypothetical protein
MNSDCFWKTFFFKDLFPVFIEKYLKIKSGNFHTERLFLKVELVDVIYKVKEEFCMKSKEVLFWFLINLLGKN